MLCNGRSRQAEGANGRGQHFLDLHLLKPQELSAHSVQNSGVQASFDSSSHGPQADVQLGQPASAAGSESIEYVYRKFHPMLRWLPSTLAEWVGDNLGPQLGIQPKRSDCWTTVELNTILLDNIVQRRDGAHLGTFGCIQWESDLYVGRPKARCYPFDLPGHRYRGKTRQVSMTSY